jgi:hypothetical protein
MQNSGEGEMDLKIDFESQLAYQADQSGMTASKQAQS